MVYPAECDGTGYDSTVATAYQPAAGTDPVWDAFVAQMQARESALANDRAYVQRQIEAGTNRGLEDLGRNAEKGRQNIGIGLRSRGITRSSVAADKLAGFEGDIAYQQQAIRRAADEQRLAGDRSYSTAIADLYAQREGEVGNSQMRIRDAEERRRLQQAEMDRQALEQKRLAEEQQKAALPPGIDFAGLARASQPAPAPAAPAEPQYDFSGIDWDGLGRMMAAQSAPQTARRSAPPPVRPPTPARKPLTPVKGRY